MSDVYDPLHAPHPPFDANDPLTAHLAFTPAEWAAMTAAAYRAGQTPVAWMRAVLRAASDPNEGD